MKLWQVCFVFAALSIHSWDSITYVNATGENLRGNLLERELQYVAQIHDKLKDTSGCNDVAVLNMSFDSERWKNEALMAVNVANLLTSLWSVNSSAIAESIVENDILLYQMVRYIVRFSPSVFGSVVCFEPNLYKDYGRFCPYAFKDKKLNGSIHVTNLARTADYDYSSSPNAIWWTGIRQKTRNKTSTDWMKETDFYSVGNANGTVENETSDRLLVTYEDGLWTRPYFDCFGGKVWMITYLAPVLNETSEFLGTVSVDISLEDVDIDQCDAPDSAEQQSSEETGDQAKPNHLSTFMGTHRCKKSTKCVPVPFQGFKRGTYRCTCKRGYYFPDPTATRKYFPGQVLEEEYDKMLRGESNLYEHHFECLACNEGCEECVDGSACVYDVFTKLRYSLLVINCLFVVISLVFAALVFKLWQNKIFKASSPRFLEVIICGAIMMYVKLIVSFPKPSEVRCILSPWLHHLGFALVYGSLALKTWRVVLIFRVRSARKLAIKDSVLLRRLAVIVLLYTSFLTVWMVIQPPSIESSITADKLKYDRCSTSSFSHMILAADFVVLAWGMWLSFKVRKVPQVYNESKFIGYAIYNATFIICFINVLSVVLSSGSSPDVMYAMDFININISASVTLMLLFSHKIFLALALRSNSHRTSPHENKLSVRSRGETFAKELDTTILGGENDELKREVRRLASKVALLQSQLMTERNRHVTKIGSS